MVRGRGAVFVAWLATGCAKPPDSGVVLTPSTLSAADPTVCQRLLARAREPRRRAAEPRTSGCAAPHLFGGWLGASAPCEVSPPAGAGIVWLGARASATTAHPCVA